MERTVTSFVFGGHYEGRQGPMRECVSCGWKVKTEYWNDQGVWRLRFTAHAQGMQGLSCPGSSTVVS